MAIQPRLKAVQKARALVRADVSNSMAIQPRQKVAQKVGAKTLNRDTFKLLGVAALARAPPHVRYRTNVPRGQRFVSTVSFSATP